jgi:Rrf2 family protein
MIRLSTKGRYATRVMIYLAMAGNGPTPKHEISQAEDITPDYTEQLLIRLRNAGLVTSRRGPKGGFLLARDPGEITVLDVIEATEGPVCLVPCEDEACTKVTTCVTHAIWEQASLAIKGVFLSVSIGELAKRSAILRDSQSLSFDI